MLWENFTLCFAMSTHLRFRGTCFLSVSSDCGGRRSQWNDGTYAMNVTALRPRTRRCFSPCYQQSRNGPCSRYFRAHSIANIILRGWYTSISANDWAWSMGGLILIAVNQIRGGKQSTTALSTLNSTCTGRMYLCGERPETDHVSRLGYGVIWPFKSRIS